MTAAGTRTRRAASSDRSERISAWTAAANRNGIVNSAEIPAIRQYVEENHVVVSCGLVVFPITLAVSCSATLAPTTVQATIAPSATTADAFALAPLLAPPPPSTVFSAEPG